MLFPSPFQSRDRSLGGGGDTRQRGSSRCEVAYASWPDEVIQTSKPSRLRLLRRNTESQVALSRPGSSSRSSSSSKSPIGSYPSHCPPWVGTYVLRYRGGGTAVAEFTCSFPLPQVPGSTPVLCHTRGGAPPDPLGTGPAGGPQNRYPWIRWTCQPGVETVCAAGGGSLMTQHCVPAQTMHLEVLT